MPKAKRDIAREILEGIAELKRGNTGRTTSVSSDARFVGSDNRAGDVAPRPRWPLRGRARGK